MSALLLLTVGYVLGMTTFAAILCLTLGRVINRIYKELSAELQGQAHD